MIQGTQELKYTDLLRENLSSTGAMESPNTTGNRCALSSTKSEDMQSGYLTRTQFISSNSWSKAANDQVDIALYGASQLTGDLCTLGLL